MQTGGSWHGSSWRASAEISPQVVEQGVVTDLCAPSELARERFILVSPSVLSLHLSCVVVQMSWLVMLFVLSERLWDSGLRWCSMLLSNYALLFTENAERKGNQLAQQKERRGGLFC
mmetsp:Transcript_32696/g.75280  ORF Transcript_32696/g.75280 Transcript_32696/m.75280 type:complete len:117 (-) Transcript_32696:86-436(-)